MRFFLLAALLLLAVAFWPTPAEVSGVRLVRTAQGHLALTYSDVLPHLHEVAFFAVRRAGHRVEVRPYASFWAYAWRRDPVCDLPADVTDEDRIFYAGSELQAGDTPYSANSPMISRPVIPSDSAKDCSKPPGT